MDILIQNALPLAAILIPAIIALRLEFVKKRKLLWGIISLSLVLLLYVFLAIVGASLSELLLVTLVVLLVCTA